MPFPSHLQRNQMDCGPTCLYLVSKHYGRSFSIEKLRELTEIGKEGVSLLGISDAAEKIGYRTQTVQPTLQELGRDVKLPTILHWSQNHFVVLYKTRPSRPPKGGEKSKSSIENSNFSNTKGTYYISDPAKGLVTYTTKEFASHWLSGTSDDGPTGVALMLEPTPAFYEHEYD